MATHPSILAQRISQTEEPGGGGGWGVGSGYSLWGHKELDRTERLILSLSYKQSYFLFLLGPLCNLSDHSVNKLFVTFSSVQPLSRVQLFATP